jgi:hypothetical protein
MLTRRRNRKATIVFLMSKLKTIQIANTNIDVTSIDQDQIVKKSEVNGSMDLRNNSKIEKPTTIKTNAKIILDDLLAIYNAPSAQSLSHVTIIRYMFIGIIIHL